MGTRRFVLPFLLLLVACASSALAQSLPAAADEPLPPPLTLSYLEGRVDIVRASGVEAARVPDVLDEDERLVVGAGRAELVFDDGTLAHADRQTDLRVDRGMRLRVVRGRVVLHTAPGDGVLTIATPAGLLRLEPQGEYDVSAQDLDGDTVIEVVSGRATVLRGDDTTPIAADDILTLDPRDLRPRWSRGTRDDAFRDWSHRRADRTTLARAAATLPPAAQPWADDFATAGAWSALPVVGPVWFPAVGPGWRPYSDGDWRRTRRGWTWIDAQRWAWPMHHYGRWGHHATRGWYWMPQRTWGPAWVGWAMSGDHIAWAPLGLDSRPVVDFFHDSRPGAEALWRASWSFVPRQAFGRPGGVGRMLVDPSRLPGPVAGGFVSQMIGPRDPADDADRFATLPPHRAASGPPSPRSQFRPAPGRSPGADGSVVVPRPRVDATPRRPMDPPSRDGEAPVATPPARPRDRQWSTAPVPDEPSAISREVAPVGPPVRPRLDAPRDDRDRQPAERVAAPERRERQSPPPSAGSPPGAAPHEPAHARGDGRSTGGARRAPAAAAPGSDPATPSRATPRRR